MIIVIYITHIFKILFYRGIKKSTNYAMNHTVDDGLEQIKNWNSAHMLSDDLNEAVRATFEKNEPKFFQDFERLLYFKICLSLSYLNIK